MAGETAQKDLVWVSLEEYSSSVEGGGDNNNESPTHTLDNDHTDMPSIVLLNGT